MGQVAEWAEEDERLVFGGSHEKQEVHRNMALADGGANGRLEAEAEVMRTNDSIDVHEPITLSELPEGLQVKQMGRTYVARNWRLSPGLLRLMSCAFEHGLTCLIRERHPLPQKADAEHVGFSKSPKDDWIFVVDQFSCTSVEDRRVIVSVTFNKAYLGVLRSVGIEPTKEKGGGKNLFVSFAEAEKAIMACVHGVGGSESPR